MVPFPDEIRCITIQMKSISWHKSPKNHPLLLFFILIFCIEVQSLARPSEPSAVVPPGICKSRVEIFRYECEEHTVTTEDGYILSLQRIPNGKSGTLKGRKKTPVLLQHGLLVDGVTWLYNSPEESLGYILADNGYDVWIANTRGTVFSRGHAMFPTNDSAYWNWSWDELVAYDLPATFNYVYRHTGHQKIHYVGHSLGTLMALASFCQMKLVNLTRSAALICPIAYMDQLTSLIARIAANIFLAEIERRLGIDEFDPTLTPVYMPLKELCKQPNTNTNCYDLVASFTGKNCCLNSSAVKVFIDHKPQSTSMKTMVHMSQMIRRGTITKFDYIDFNENMKHYGQAKPPAYNISAIPKDLPLFISHGGEDSLSDVNDVKHLLRMLKFHDENKLRVQFQANYGHGDFVMGFNANKFIYDPLISFLKCH